MSICDKFFKEPCKENESLKVVLISARTMYVLDESVKILAKYVVLKYLIENSFTQNIVAVQIFQYTSLKGVICGDICPENELKCFALG